MKYIALTLLFSLLVQPPKIITLNGYYSGKGVIFDKTSNYPFITTDYKKPYTPTIKDITNAENILFDKYYSHRISLLERFGIDKKEIKKKYKSPNKVKKKFYKHYRQYVGYINKNKDTIIYVGLFNFYCKKRAKKYFEGWDKVVFLGSGKYYERNQESYLINLTSKKIVDK